MFVEEEKKQKAEKSSNLIKILHCSMVKHRRKAGADK